MSKFYVNPDGTVTEEGQSGVFAAHPSHPLHGTQLVINDDGSIGEDTKVEEVDPAAELAAQLEAVVADNANMIGQLVERGVNPSEAIPPLIMLKLKLDALTDFVVSSVPADVANVFHLSLENKIGDLLQAVTAEVMRPKLHVR